MVYNPFDRGMTTFFNSHIYFQNEPLFCGSILSALECKADYLQPVNDITRKPTLIASLSTVVQDVPKIFKNTTYSSHLFFCDTYHY